ncbi:MAG: LUD domain-containing protein [Bacteroidetes bacterium]|nr:LUD domain-containing protein [Bacteroidota bacterium]
MSREQILSRIRNSKPSANELPAIPAFASGNDRIQSFRSALESNQARVVVLETGESWTQHVALQYPDAKKIFSNLPELPSTVHDTQVSALAQLDLVVVKAELGVADNGAVWISDKSCPIRVLPFIGRHLMVIVDSSTIVANLHEAYQTINPRQSGFGVFISGPSKTADIEQALVVGAQGPVSMTVIVTS